MKVAQIDTPKADEVLLLGGLGSRVRSRGGEGRRG